MSLPDLEGQVLNLLNQLPPPSVLHMVTGINLYAFLLLDLVKLIKQVGH